MRMFSRNLVKLKWYVPLDVLRQFFGTWVNTNNSSSSTEDLELVKNYTRQLANSIITIKIFHNEFKLKVAKIWKTARDILIFTIRS